MDAQRRAIIASAEAAGLVIRAWYEDAGISGAKGVSDGDGVVSLDAAARPGLAACLAELKAGDALLVAKRDRIGRDRLLLLLVERRILRRRARLVSAAGEGSGGEDPASVMMRAVIDVMSEHERGLIRERTRAALAAKAARGERIGGVPYGFAVGDNNQLVVDTAEAAIVDAVAEIVSRDKAVSLRSIGSELSHRGLSPRSGAQWHPQTVKRILERIHGR